MMTRFVQLLVLSVAAAPLAEACDATAIDSAGCQKSATECATDAGADVCKALDCGLESAKCVAKSTGDAGCCDTLGAAYEAAGKAWDQYKTNDAYKDCTIADYPACGGATSTTMSAFALVAVLLAKMF